MVLKKKSLLKGNCTYFAYKNCIKNNKRFRQNTDNTAERHVFSHNFTVLVGRSVSQTFFFVVLIYFVVAFWLFKL